MSLFSKAEVYTEAKFSLPGSLSCTEERCLGLGNSCWKEKTCFSVQAVTFLLSVALSSNIRTLRGLLAGLEGRTVERGRQAGARCRGCGTVALAGGPPPGWGSPAPLGPDGTTDPGSHRLGVVDAYQGKSKHQASPDRFSFF